MDMELGPPRARAGIALAAGILLGSGAALARADTVYVDASNYYGLISPDGSAARPYGSISAALAARGGPGTTILVRPGTYREQVNLSRSGSADAPLVIQASGPGVILDGADDLASSTAWTAFTGNAYVAASVTWAPRQVFADGARLAAMSTADNLPKGSFAFVPGVGLVVNLGGDHPAAHRILVGRRANAFRIGNVSFVRIRGFDIRRFEDRGILLQGSTAARDTVVQNFVSCCGSQGIAIYGASECVVGSNSIHDNADHGIYLIGVQRSAVEWNHVYANRRPGQRAANGLNLFASSGNRIVGNRWHHNQDSGQQLTAGSNDNLILYNRSWSNGDHGYDHLGSTGNALLGCVAWGNWKDGFSFEGNSPGNRVCNSIASDNGLSTTEYDLWVDSTSTLGFVSKSNVLWNSIDQAPVKWVTTRYSRIVDFGAVSQSDTRSVQADPRFVDPATGDFRVLEGSSAIDNADVTVSGWPTIDLAGGVRLDDLNMTNRGAGNVTYADCGVFGRGAAPERGPDDPPVGRTSAHALAGAAEPALSEGFPAPAHAQVSFTLDLPRATPVGWEVLDVAGRRIHSEQATYESGRSDWTWRPSASTAGGCYFVRASIGSAQFTRRVVLAR